MLLKGLLFSDIIEPPRDQIQSAGSSFVKEIQIFKTGKFSHPVYGDFEITAQTLAEMKDNFDNRVRRVDLSVDYYHESDKAAAGWFKKLRLNEDGSELWAEVEFTPKASQMLRDKELRYFSPDFTFEWSDPETGQIFNNVLFGGGLTNRPFLKDMQPVALTEKGNKMSTPPKKDETMTPPAPPADAPPQTPPAPPKKASDPEEQSEVDTLKGMIAELQAALAKAQSDNAAMAEENQKYAEAKKMAEKEAKFTLLLTEGKACVAQKESFMKDDMAGFIALSQPVNIKGAGTSVDNSSKIDDEDAVLKLAETKVKEGKFSDLGKAISAVRQEMREAGTEQK